MYSVFEYYSNNILFVFVFGHNSEPEYYSYSYSAKYLCTNIIRIRIRSFWENEYYSYSYSVKILIPNIIRNRIRSKKQYSLTSACNKSQSYLNMDFAWWSNNILKKINPVLPYKDAMNGIEGFKQSFISFVVLLFWFFCIVFKDVMNMKCGLQAILDNKTRVKKQQIQGCHE